jgi:hypothetical protein
MTCQKTRNGDAMANNQFKELLYIDNICSTTTTTDIYSFRFMHSLNSSLLSLLQSFIHSFTIFIQSINQSIKNYNYEFILALGFLLHFLQFFQYFCGMSWNTTLYICKYPTQISLWINEIRLTI